jgi:hypothetical protein
MLTGHHPWKTQAELQHEEREKEQRDYYNRIHGFRGDPNEKGRYPMVGLQIMPPQPGGGPINLTINAANMTKQEMIDAGSEILKQAGVTNNSGPGPRLNTSQIQRTQGNTTPVNPYAAFGLNLPPVNTF